MIFKKKKVWGQANKYNGYLTRWLSKRENRENPKIEILFAVVENTELFISWAEGKELYLAVYDLPKKTFFKFKETIKEILLDMEEIMNIKEERK